VKKNIVAISLAFLAFSGIAQQRQATETDETDTVVISTSNENELVPTGYGLVQEKKQVISAIGMVNAVALRKSSVWNPENALYGKIPGLIVLQNGGTSWDANPSIYIRGVETFGVASSFNTNILTLVDGFERQLSSLSLAEIQSVAVLKDGAALARFGMRGANGVLLVTTKQGSGKQLSVDVNYERGITYAFRLPKFMTSYDYARSVNQARLNEGSAPLYSQTELDKFQSGSTPYLYPNVNWQKEALRDHGNSDLLNVSFQQQTGNVKYFTLLNYQGEDGFFGPVNATEGYTTQSINRKLNFRSNIDLDLTKTTLLSVRLAGKIGQGNRPRDTENGIFSVIYNTPAAAYPVRTSTGTWGGTSNYNNNPVALISGTGYTVHGQRELMTDFVLQQKLDNWIKGLSVRAAFSYDASMNYQDSKTKQFQYNQVTPILDPITGDIQNTVTSSYGTNTPLAFSTFIPGQYRRLTSLGDVQYERNKGDNEIKATILFQKDELVRNGQNNTYRHLLAAGNLHYGKSEKYFADISLSANGTNVLPTASRVGWFPAFALGWRLTNEEWFKGDKVFNDVKIRASWGMSGNDQIIQNTDKSAWVPGTGYYFGANNGPVSGYSEGRLASAPLTYETSYKSNIGIDARLLDMLDLNVDVFYNKRKGILVETVGTISDVLGVSKPYSSSGIVSNKGIEIGLNLSKSLRNFNYYVNGQLTYTKNKVIEMLEAYRPEEYLKRTGQSIGQAYGLEAIGFFNDAAQIAASPKQTFGTVMPGDVKYKDQNNDGIINAFDEVRIGHSGQVPEIYYSFSVGMEYKGIGMDACFQGAANETIYLNTSSIFWPLVNGTNISTYSAGAWTPQTTSTATLPRLTTSSNANNYRPNSIWLTNGAFLKLRSVELYYNFPSQLISKAKLSKAKIYVRGMNLLSIDKIKIVDPEAIGNIYPTQSSFNFGIQFGF
jgi:TonB-linked SusC/RagA family outer membrane protein